jgi:hypothetical protein
MGPSDNSHESGEAGCNKERVIVYTDKDAVAEAAEERREVA